EVLLGHPASEAARHRVGISGHDIGSRIEDRLADVVLGARPRLPRLRDRRDVGGRGPDGAAVGPDLMAARAVLLAIDLRAARDRVGRPRLRTRDGERTRREGDPEKPHHPRVNSTAALRGATVVLGDRAILRGFDLEIRPGVTVVRGGNGAGKTTLLRTLAGLLPLSRGTPEPGG